VKTKFDTLFAEEFEHFNAPLEEQEHVSVKLTREEAMAIRGFLQGEGFEDDSWGSMRTQLSETPALAAVPVAVVGGGAALGTAAAVGATPPVLAGVGGAGAAGAGAGATGAGAAGATRAATAAPTATSRAATLAKDPKAQAGYVAGNAGDEDAPAEEKPSGSGTSRGGPSSVGGTLSPTNVAQANV
jgi:hypothetical protein